MFHASCVYILDLRAANSSGQSFNCVIMYLHIGRRGLTYIIQYKARPLDNKLPLTSWSVSGPDLSWELCIANMNRELVFNGFIGFIYYIYWCSICIWLAVLNCGKLRVAE